MTGKRESPELLDSSVLEGYRKTLQSPSAPDIVKRLIDIYCVETPISLSTLQQSLRDLDPDTLYKAAHALKSSSASVGAMSLSTLCRQIELLGRAGDINGASPLVRKLPEVYRQTVGLLRSAFPNVAE